MRFWRSSLAGLVVLGLAAVAGASGPVGLLPPSDALPGWSWSAEPRSYTAANLFDYIDGAADLFLAYGFEGLAAADYVKEGDADRLVTVDVYDMGSPLHAYGVFATERPPEEGGSCGDASRYESGGLIALWKGRHYVKIAVMEERDLAAGRALAGVTAEGLPGCTDLPAEFGRLPCKDRVAGSEGYVRRDALGHGFLKEVVSADYRQGKAVATLHVADLSTAEAAAQGWGRLRDFERRAGKGLASVGGLGSGAFGATDPSYGEMVAAYEGRFVVIAMGEKASREGLGQLAAGALAGVRPRAEERVDAPGAEAEAR